MQKKFLILIKNIKTKIIWLKLRIRVLKRKINLKIIKLNLPIKIILRKLCNWKNKMKKSKKRLNIIENTKK